MTDRRLIVHVLFPDKFTVPIIGYLRRAFGDAYDQRFLCVTGVGLPDELHRTQETVILRNPHRRHLRHNTILVHRLFREADRVILHGLPLMYYLILFPWVLRKSFWIIFGSSDLTSSIETGSAWLRRSRTFVIRRIHGHLTHLREDSELVNQTFGATGTHVYSPVYRSNVVAQVEIPARAPRPAELHVLVGNSTSPSNRHAPVLHQLAALNIDGLHVHCPLSYGAFPAYKAEVVALGRRLFGERFHPLTDFMPLEDYQRFLGSIDAAIFNHPHQEAMGVTISLLSMGKKVFAYPDTTAFRSLRSRGFELFDNRTLSEAALRAPFDPTRNRARCQQFYSSQALHEGWLATYTHPLTSTK